MRTSRLPAALETLEIKGVPEQVADHLREEIEAGVLAPGATLNQVDLAARFGMSRIPVREALRQLEAEGYVTYRPNRGASVVDALSREEALEILEIRECLEARLMERVVRRRTPAALREAAAALEALNRATAVEDLRGVHERFHTALFQPAERPRTVAIINGWRFRLDHRPDIEGARKRAFALATRGVHRRLLAACARGDRAGAQRCVAEEYAIIRESVMRPQAAARTTEAAHPVGAGVPPPAGPGIRGRRRAGAGA